MKSNFIKKVINIFVTAVLMGCMLTGCGESQNTASNSGGSSVKVYMNLATSTDTFRNTIVEAAKSTAAQAGVELTVEAAEGSVDAQSAQIKQAVSSGYDVIICNPVDPATALQLEVAAGELPIVFFNSCPDENALEAGKYVYVGSDEKVAGEYQTEKALEMLSSKDEINVALFMGEKGHSATVGRTDAVKHALKVSGKKINYVFCDYANWDTDIAAEMYKLFLKTGKTADCVICNNDSMALGVIKACKEEGIDLSTLPILGVDATTEGCLAIKNGEMSFTVYQSASGQGKAVIDAAKALAAGQGLDNVEYVSDDKIYVWVPFEKVDSSNVDNYMSK